MNYWELPNVFWGAVLSVWVSLILSDVSKSSYSIFIPFSFLFLFLLSAVLIFLDRGIVSGYWLHYIFATVAAIALAAEILIFIEFEIYTAIPLNMNINSVIFITLLLIFWISSVEYKRYESKKSFRDEGWYE